VHINPKELKKLQKLLGFKGAPNPDTGLLAFDDTGDGGNGNGNGSDTSSGNSNGNGSGNGNGNGNSNGNTSDANTGNATDQGDGVSGGYGGTAAVSSGSYGATGPSTSGDKEGVAQGGYGQSQAPGTSHESATMGDLAAALAEGRMADFVNGLGPAVANAAAISGSHMGALGLAGLGFGPAPVGVLGAQIAADIIGNGIHSAMGALGINDSGAGQGPSPNGGQGSGGDMDNGRAKDTGDGSNGKETMQLISSLISKPGKSPFELPFDLPTMPTLGLTNTQTAANPILALLK
jgi:hypothetical protein